MNPRVAGQMAVRITSKVLATVTIPANVKNAWGIVGFWHIADAIPGKVRNLAYEIFDEQGIPENELKLNEWVSMFEEAGMRSKIDEFFDAILKAAKATR